MVARIPEAILAFGRAVAIIFIVTDFSPVGRKISNKERKYLAAAGYIPPCIGYHIPRYRPKRPASI
jgi:hypothetical protein